MDCTGAFRETGGQCQEVLHVQPAGIRPDHKHRKEGEVKGQEGCPTVHFVRIRRDAQTGSDYHARPRDG